MLNLLESFRTTDNVVAYARAVVEPAFGAVGSKPLEQDPPHRQRFARGHVCEARCLVSHG